MKKHFYKILIIFFILLFVISNFSLCGNIDNNKIEPPNTNSRSCVVIDRNSNTILYGKNETQKRKMASTTKIMTATIIIEKFDLKDTIEVSKKAAGTGGSRLGLKTGDKITVNDLLYGLMLRSGNDAAVALAEYAGGSIEGFAELMNKKALDLGLINTHFETPHGLDSDNHYTTAYELALLSNYALNNSTFSQIVGTKNYTININGYPKQLNNTNELLGNLDGVYGIKTGFTNGANRCLVTACKRNDMDIICVVLGADTKNFRTLDSIKLINYIFDNFKPVNIKDLIDNDFKNWKKDNLNKIKINKGTSQYIDLKLEYIDKAVIPIRKDLIDSINITIHCPLYFEAPLASNSAVGNINVSISEYLDLNYKINNVYEIKSKSWNMYLFDLFRNYSSILNTVL